MATPDQELERIIDTIEKTVEQSIRIELKKNPGSASGVPLDLDEFREELLTVMQAELQAFKEEVLAALMASQPVKSPQGQQSSFDITEVPILGWFFVKKKED